VNFHFGSGLIRTFWIVAGLFLLILLAACQEGTYAVDHEQLSKEERIVIRFSHIVGENTPKGLAARKFAKLVKEKSNGYVEVQIFPNGYLYKDGEELEALLDGDIQMIAPATSKITSLVPEWQVLDLPFAFQDVNEVHEYLEGNLSQGLMNKLQTSGLYPLAIWDNGFKQITNNSHPIMYPEEFSGLRFRIMPSPVIKNQFETLGANTQSNSFNEVYQLLDQGSINAQENTFSNIVSKDLPSLQKYLTVSNHGYLGYFVLMNKEFWNDLPKDVQDLIIETMKEVTEWEIQMAKKLNGQNLLDLEMCNCIEIHVLSNQEKQLWEDALTPVYNQFEERFGAEYILQLPKNKEVKIPKN
jgi:tripartite ATP-independent transporter DctP family solute receptor